LQEIDKQAGRLDRVIHVLLEIRIAQEDNKHGFSPEECKMLFMKDEINACHHLRLCGLMGMATFTGDKEQVRKEFHLLHNLFDELKSCRFKDHDYFTEISMGMTDDYEIALSEGSTIVRIGSFIFGART
jgi:pyridoxal phosphate enzyme (YggS family)